MGVCFPVCPINRVFVCVTVFYFILIQDGDALGSLSRFKQGDDPTANSELKSCDNFKSIESDLTFLGICGIKVITHHAYACSR